MLHKLGKQTAAHSNYYTGRKPDEHKNATKVCDGNMVALVGTTSFMA